MIPLVIAGAGGAAREIRFLIEEINRVTPRWDFAGYLIPDPSRPGPHDDTASVIGNEDWLSGRGQVAVVLGMGNPQVRMSAGRAIRARFSDVEFPVLVAPNATVDARTCTLGEGTVVSFNATLTVNIRTGPFCYINYGVRIGHEARLGEGCVINPNGCLSGGVMLGDAVLIGTGAHVLQYRAVGDGSVVGAQALVTRDVPDGVTVTGIPARVRGTQA